MCGLAGLFVSGGRSEAVLRADVGRMTSTLVHRGPDDAGLFVDAASGIGLGFRRLSIIDLSPAGHQPMASPSGRYTMVFNGEVFNSEALAGPLRDAGVRFRGHSDTEVMLAAFEQWGVVPATQRFVGMFAIALWDRDRRELHLIRDRLGIKPMFVHRSPTGIVTFGSELKALIAGPEFERAVDPASLRAYLRYFYVPAPRAIFKDTRKVLPGTILTIRDTRAPLPDGIAFWSAIDEQRKAAAAPFTGSPEDAVDAVDAQLTEAVRMRMAHADVPVGAFLSGGIDSSTVVALMQRAASNPVKTYTIAFNEAEYDESSHAAVVAKHLGTAHTALRLSPAEAQAVVPMLPDMFDEPFADVSQIPTYLVSRLARSEVTVALSGDGGDEVFGGYNRYSWGEQLYHRFAPVPMMLRHALGAGLTALPPEQWEHLWPRRWRTRLLGEKVHKVGALLRQRGASDFYLSLVAAWADPETLVPGAPCPTGLFEQVMGASTPRSLSERMMLADLVTYLPDNNLAKVDRASMAVSLEVRVPILDHRVVELAFSLPPALKARPGSLKWVLRNVLYRYVPREIVEREKMGFDVPIGAWLRGPLKPWAEDLLSVSALAAAGLNPTPIRSTWSAHLAGRGNHGTALWAVLMLQAWRAKWLSPQQTEHVAPPARVARGA